MKTDELPYPECEKCRTLADCKHVEKGIGLESELPPDNCPQPMAIMRRTMHKRKLDRNKRYS